MATEHGSKHRIEEAALSQQGETFRADGSHRSTEVAAACHRYRIVETAGGYCGIAWTSSGISRVQLPAVSAETTEVLLRRRFGDDAMGVRSSALRRACDGADIPSGDGSGLDVEAVVRRIRRYFAGENVDFGDLPLDLSGQSQAFRNIYAVARRLAWGETTTYGTIAKEVGAGPEAAREVGQAMAKNPIPLIIPCHRVLAAGGRLGGFSAPGGTMSKTRMLEMEGVRLGSAVPEQRSFGF